MKAREEELAEFRKHNVYAKVPLEECYRITKKGPIGVRWVDINKGDSTNPEYRSRLVAKEIKLSKTKTYLRLPHRWRQRNSSSHLLSQRESAILEGIAKKE